MNMRRISAAHAYLLPALSRKNLTLLAGIDSDEARHQRRQLPRRRGDGGRAGAALRGSARGRGLRRRIEVAEASDAVGHRTGGASAPAQHPGGRRCAADRRQPARSPAGASGVLDQGQGRAADRHRAFRHHLHAEQRVAEGTGHPGVRPPERAEREGPAARHGLSHHARPDEAEEPRHGAARLGRSERAAPGRPAAISPSRPTSMPT